MSIRYAFFALKTPNSFSSTQTFGLITNIDDQSYYDNNDSTWVYDTSYYETVFLGSNSGNKSFGFAPVAKYKINSGDFNTSYIGAVTGSNLWNSSSNYLMMFEYVDSTTIIGNQNAFLKTSIIGAYDDGESAAVSSFRGYISEIIFASGTLTPTQLDLIRDQLNDIHGIY